MADGNETSFGSFNKFNLNVCKTEFGSPSINLQITWGVQIKFKSGRENVAPIDVAVTNADRNRVDFLEYRYLLTLLYYFRF